MASDGLRCYRAGDAVDSRAHGHACRRTQRPSHRIPRPHVVGDADCRAVASGGFVVTNITPKATAARESLLDLLSSIKDPELPVVNIVELGIVRDIIVEGDSVQVDVTPTYSGCPAMQVIEQDIVQALEGDGFKTVK